MILVADASTSALHVTNMLDLVKADRDPPVVRTDNGPEFTEHTMRDRAAMNAVERRVFQPSESS